MTVIKEGRYRYIILPEQKIVKCISSYAKRPVTGVAICAPEDDFDADVGKTIARVRCDEKVIAKRIKYLKENLDAYYDCIQYYMKEHGKLCALLHKAEAEKRQNIHEQNQINDIVKG